MSNKSQTFRKLNTKQIQKLSDSQAEVYAFEVGQRMGKILEDAQKELNKLTEFSKQRVKLVMQLEQKPQA